MEKENSNIGLVAIIFILAIIMSIVSIGIFKAVKKNDKIQEAHIYISLEKFEDGIKIYDELLKNGNDSEIAHRKKIAIDLKDAKINFERGKKALDLGDLGSAKSYFEKVSELDSERFEESKQELKKLKENSYENSKENESDLKENQENYKIQEILNKEKIDNNILEKTLLVR